MVKNLMKNMLEIYIKKCELAKEYLPEFINIHLHGGGGADTMDATQKAMDKISVNPKIFKLFLKGLGEMDHDTKTRFRITFGRTQGLGNFFCPFSFNTWVLLLK